MESFSRANQGSGAGSQSGRQAAAPVSISLILPARDEAGAIAQTLREANAAVAAVTPDYEILLIDDGSVDATRAIAEQAMRELPRLRVISHDAPLGIGAALRTGIKAATGKHVVLADADGQYDLAEIDRLELLAGRYDLVCGYRLDRQDAWYRCWLATLYNLVLRLLLGTKLRDCDCAFKLARADLLSRLDLTANDEFLHAELVIKARLSGAEVIEVGVSHRARAQDRSKISWRQILPTVSYLLRCWWNVVLFPGHAAKATETNEADDRVRVWHIAMLGVVAVAMLFTRLTYPLMEPDEARYAVIAADMLETGNWIIPMHWGGPYLDKPPLLYWLTAISYRLFGVHDHSARFVAALAGMGTLAVTYLLGRKLVGKRGAILGALALLSSFGFILSTRFLIMDGLLTLFTTCTTLSLFLATRGARLDRRWWLLAAVACGLGVMTKGPVAVVLSFPPLIAARWLSQSGAPVRWRDWAWFGVAFTAVTAPWFVAASIQDSSFLKHFFWTHHVVRYTTKFAHSEPWWFYGLVLTIGLFPTGMLLPALVAYLRSKTAALRDGRTWEQGFLLLSAAWVVIFFSTSRGKLPPYVLPSLPLLCLALGAMIDRGLLSNVADATLEVLRKALPFHGTRIVLIAGMVMGVVDAVIDGWEPVRWLDGAAISAAAAGLFYFVSRKSFTERPARWVAAGAMPLLLMAVGLIHIYPQIALERSTAERVLQYRAEYNDQTTPVVSFQLDQDSMSFYNRGVETRMYGMGERPMMIAYLAAHPQTLLISPPDFLKLLRSELPPNLQVETQPNSRDRVYLVRNTSLPAANVSAVPAKVETK